MWVERANLTSIEAAEQEGKGKEQVLNEEKEEGPGDLEADATGGAGDDAGEAIERGDGQRVLNMAGGDPLEEELPDYAAPSSPPFDPPQRFLLPLLPPSIAAISTAVRWGRQRDRRRSRRRRCAGGGIHW